MDGWIDPRSVESSVDACVQDRQAAAWKLCATPAPINRPSPARAKGRTARWQSVGRSTNRSMRIGNRAKQKQLRSCISTPAPNARPRLSRSLIHRRRRLIGYIAPHGAGIRRPLSHMHTPSTNPPPPDPQSPTATAKQNERAPALRVLPLGGGGAQVRVEGRRQREDAQRRHAHHQQGGPHHGEPDPDVRACFFGGLCCVFVSWSGGGGGRESCRSRGRTPRERPHHHRSTHPRHLRLTYHHNRNNHRRQLLRDKQVKFAGYIHPHPLLHKIEVRGACALSSSALVGVGDAWMAATTNPRPHPQTSQHPCTHTYASTNTKYTPPLK